MGLDMMLYKYPKVDLSLRTIQAADDFVNKVCNDIPYWFETWYNFYNSHSAIPTMKEIAYLLKICPEGNFYKEVGYWRKANAIHKWFVDNVQDGIDDCRCHRPVTKEDLKTLADLCKGVLDDHSKAEKILPTMCGFFFGTYDYDDIYFEKIQYTYDLCMRLIEEFDFEKYNLYYVTSW